jgi:hypothetical protein
MSFCERKRISVQQKDGLVKMPNYNEMSLIELKQAAKGRGIKMYYVMKKNELAAVLSMGELTPEMKLQKKTIRQLREEAKNQNIPGVWKYSRAELVELMYSGKKAAADKDEENHGNAKEHDDPEEHNAQ